MKLGVKTYSQERLTQVLLAPVVSEKSTFVGEKNNQFVFRVAPDATKPEVKAAVELLFSPKDKKLEVEGVRIVNVKGKEKRMGKFVGRRSGWKKAYVSLKAGQDITFAEGAGVGVPYITAWRALFDKGRAVPGETVLIHGASGAVGVAATQAARAVGLRILGTAGSERGLELARTQGAHHVFDHSKPGYEKEITATTGGRGVDLVIEMLANVNLARDLELIAKRGRIVVVGNRGSLELNPRLIMGKDATIVGLTNFNATPSELAIAHAAIVAGMEHAGYKPQVGKEMPLADAPRAHEDVMKSGAFGKIVLIT